jgi:hypothetical protein
MIRIKARHARHVLSHGNFPDHILFPEIGDNRNLLELSFTTCRGGTVCDRSTPLRQSGQAGFVFPGPPKSGMRRKKQCQDTQGIFPTNAFPSPDRFRKADPKRGKKRQKQYRRAANAHGKLLLGVGMVCCAYSIPRTSKDRELFHKAQRPTGTSRHVRSGSSLWLGAPAALGILSIVLLRSSHVNDFR